MMKFRSKLQQIWWIMELLWHPFGHKTNSIYCDSIAQKFRRRSGFKCL